MTMSSDDAVDVARPLPPHGPANMMSTYMTRYDYDYNGHPGLTGSDDGNGRNFEPGISGDVRNRPIFAYGVDTGDRDDHTIYQVDYTAKDRSVKNMAGLAARLTSASVPAAAAAINDVDKGTAYQRHWYRPGISDHIVLADGSHPHTVYQDDYQAPRHVAGGTVSEPVRYAGAAAAAYNADLLKPHGVVEDDGADLAPKITSRESLLPRRRKCPNTTWSPVFENTTDHRRTWNDCAPGDGVTGTYMCTSWEYGGTSQAHPSQLPLSLARSLAAHGLDVTANLDKAALLRQLAGAHYTPRTVRSSLGGVPLDTSDRTNPQFLSTMEQKRCAVSRRLEKEHYVTMSIYKSDFIDQGLLPELPGNPGGPANVRDTHPSPLATAGEMMAGQLTSTTRELGLLRNAHGTLKPGEAHPASRMRTGVLSVVRKMEKAVSIDKADPHRHKLRA
ncbi:hypothetical protein LPMP_110760 [Leishmania panamensis]|uniref:Uncharacterized protein n=1 Tax=Leishmania panamensis TaxID=5679 RepID=A0A088S482_LEIPA|nr:hypothetical protein LPMP_110760 [Leishmania panamensis]AIN96271.1 hypothetical protein LPMP_110760 [Leishmania panamensis]